MTYDDFEAVVDVHLRGAFHVVRPAFPLMCEAGYGRIVLTSSIGGLYGNHEVANYAVAKAGVIGLSNVAAIEGAAARRQEQRHRARCGDAEWPRASTPRPTRRWARSLVAPVVGWLAHESCSVTGEMLVALAGRVAQGRRRRNARRISAVVVHGRCRRTHRRDPRRVGSRRLSRWCPTATATTSATASGWRPKRARSMASLAARWPACRWSTSPRW